MASAVRSGSPNATATATGRGRRAPARWSYASPSCAKVATSRASWNRAGWQRRRWRWWCRRPSPSAGHRSRSQLDSSCSSHLNLARSEKSTPAWALARQHVTAPAIKEGHDSWKQGGGDHGVAVVRQMDKVKGAIAQRDLLIVHDHLNRASAQPALHLRKVGSTLLSGAEEAQIVAARLQDRDVCSVRHILVDAAKHHRRSVKRHSGIGDLSTDALGSEQALQLRGLCASFANVPAMR